MGPADPMSSDVPGIVRGRPVRENPDYPGLDDAFEALDALDASDGFLGWGGAPISFVKGRVG